MHRQYIFLFSHLESVTGASLRLCGDESLDLGRYKSCSVLPGATFSRSAALERVVLSLLPIERSSNDLKLAEFVWIEKKTVIHGFSVLVWTLTLCLKFCVTKRGVRVPTVLSLSH